MRAADRPRCVTAATFRDDACIEGKIDPAVRQLDPLARSQQRADAR